MAHKNQIPGRRRGPDTVVRPMRATVEQIDMLLAIYPEESKTPNAVARCVKRTGLTRKQVEAYLHGELPRAYLAAKGRIKLSA